MMLKSIFSICSRKLGGCYEVEVIDGGYMRWGRVVEVRHRAERVGDGDGFRGRLLTGAAVGLVGGAYASTLDEATFSGWLFSATKIANPLFALLDPEVAHRLAISAAARGLVPKEKRPDQEILGLEVWGRRFSNPIGLSAGFDKNAEAVEGLLGLGFGFVEVGSVTPLPQEGNPKPRMFRLRDQG
ncbi:hypothetical protein QVD17_30500 [Tagetes erecta]|uniref:Dihydroorotate dehydrogenase catalytic domain-containing protein n=1 Tax=Tagetes erecta TaxID=13708 RepID=A0AAD8K2S3_TARER|nr:hypothetical protein QVD17_30500 [Tagetes erecta]